MKRRVVRSAGYRRATEIESKQILVQFYFEPCYHSSYVQTTGQRIPKHHMKEKTDATSV